MKSRRKFSVVPVPAPVLVLGPHTMAEKLAAAIAYLGPKWRHHPQHDPKLIRSGILSEWRASLPRYRP